MYGLLLGVDGVPLRSTLLLGVDGVPLRSTVYCWEWMRHLDVWSTAKAVTVG